MSDEIGMKIAHTTSVGMRTKSFTLPSGFLVTIRELNGEDEDLISKMGKSMLASMDELIAGVVIGPKVYTPKDVSRWKTIDRYYLLLELRVLSHGSEMDFKVQLTDESGKPTREVEFKEDLSKYMADLSKELPEKTFEYRIDKHPGGEKASRQLTLSSGKEVRYLFANGESEVAGVKIGPENISRNDVFKLRKLEYRIGEEWLPVENFSQFTPRDTRELRKDIEEMDVEFGLITEITNPDTGIKAYHTLVEFQEFFFPN